MPQGLPPMAGVGLPGLKLTKGAAALPVVSVGSVIVVEATKCDAGGRTSLKASGSVGVLLATVVRLIAAGGITE